MTNRTGRTIRRALAVMLGLGGLGVYATAQQPKPLVVTSTGTPGVYTVSGPTPARLLPPSVMPGVPAQPADSSVATEPIAAKPSVLPGVPVQPVQPVETAVVRDVNPVKPPTPATRPPAATVVRVTKPTPPTKHPIYASPPPDEPVAANSAMPLAPLAPVTPQAVTPVGLVVPEGPLAPVAPLAPKPVASTDLVSPPVVAVPVAPAVRKPQVVVEKTSSQVASDLPGVPTPPVLLAPVLAPAAPAPMVPSLPGIPTIPAPIAQAAPPPAIVIPTIRTPIIAAQPVPTPQTPVVASTVTTCSTDKGPTCKKCPRGKSHCDCCVCAPATVPPPVGSTVRSAFGTQRANALDEYCVVYQEDFDQGTDTLNPTGERHISGIARRFDQTRAPVKIEPTGDPALDQRRASTVTSALVKSGIPVEVVANRVQGGISRAEGMPPSDIEPTYVRYGFGGYGVGGQGASYGGFATFGPFLPYYR